MKVPLYKDPTDDVLGPALKGYAREGLKPKERLVRLKAELNLDIGSVMPLCPEGPILIDLLVRTEDLQS
jgi:hypothetical protein